MATQLKQTDFQPTYYPPTRPNLRVVFDTTCASRAVAAALDQMPAATGEAVLEDLAQPSLARWKEAVATLDSAQGAIRICPAEPEDAFNAANSALAQAQIALLTTPAPTQAELATKVQLYFDIDASEFCEPAIDASIKADTARLLTAEAVGTGEWADAISELHAIRAALDAKGLSDEQIDELSSRELTAAKRLLAVPGSSVADIATKLRVWLSVVSPAGDEPAGILADLERLGSPAKPDAWLLAAFAEYRAAVIEHDALPLDATTADEEVFYKRMDQPELTMLNTPATTVDGVLAKLRYYFHSAGQNAWSQDAIVHPYSPRFREGLEMAGMPDRTLWGAIEDLARIAGTSLTEKAA